MTENTAPEYHFSLRHLTVGYDGKPLIRDITLSLQKGEILTLIGPNGAGKSTVLKTIAGQLPLLEGCVMLTGQDMAAMKRQKKATEMAVVLTRGMHAGRMSCREVVSMGRYPYTGRFGRLTAEDGKIVEEAMELADITDIAEREYGQVSDGQRQRVLLARAFCQQPGILILDEPTSFLDIRYKMEFVSVLRKMQQRYRMTVIMSLHELELARYISDRILCLEGGLVRYYGQPDEVFEGEIIRQLFGMSAEQFEQAQKIGLVN